MNNAKLKIYTREKGKILSSNSKIIPKNERPSSALHNKSRATPSPNKYHLKKPTLGTSSNNINIDTSLPNIGSLTPIKTHSNLIGIRNENSLLERSVTPTKKRYELKKDSIIEENLQLKNQIQKLQTEVAQKRADFYRLENELRQKDKLIDELVRVDKHNLLNGNTGAIMQTPEKKFKNKELALILSMKRQIKEMQRDMKLKDDLVEGLRKQIKLTKLNEYETEIKTLNEEIFKLKTLYENEINLKELKEKEPNEFQFLKESHTSQQQLINSLQEHNSKLLQEKKEKEEKIQRLKQKYKGPRESMSENSVCKVDSSVELKAQTSEMENRISELLKEVEYYKDQSHKREKWIKELEENYDKNAKDTKEYYESIRNKDKEVIDELVEENKILNDKLHTKDEEILQWNQKLKEIDHHYQTKIDEVHRNREELEKNSQVIPSIHKEKRSLIIEVLSLNEMETLRYVLNQWFSGKKVDFYKIKSVIEEIKDFNIDLNDYFLAVVDSILTLLDNKNNNNSKQLTTYFRNLSLDNSTLSIDAFKINFYDSLDIKNYTDDLEVHLSNILKNNLSKFKASLTKKLKRFDYHNSGYVTFGDLEHILKKYNLDKELFDFLVIKMKSYPDEFSNWYDMKYELMLNLLDDVDPPESKPHRKGSATSDVIINKSEEIARSEEILKKIAEFIYRNETTIRKIFSDTILIGEKNLTYTAMYLAVFLNILKEDMSISLDATDSICIFNRLKNPSNLHCIELVDVDLLAQELTQFGIKEYEDDAEADLHKVEEGSNWDEKLNDDALPEINPIDELLTSKEQDQAKSIHDDEIHKEDDKPEEINEEQEIPPSDFMIKGEDEVDGSIAGDNNTEIEVQANEGRNHTERNDLNEEIINPTEDINQVNENDEHESHSNNTNRNVEEKQPSSPINHHFSFDLPQLNLIQEVKNFLDNHHKNYETDFVENLPYILTEETLRLVCIENVIDYLYDNDVIKHRRVDRSNLFQITNQEGMINLDLLKRTIQLHKTYSQEIQKVNIQGALEESKDLVTETFKHVLEKHNTSLEKKRSHYIHGPTIPMTMIDDGEHFLFHQKHDSDHFTSQIFQSAINQHEKIAESKKEEEEEEEGKSFEDEEQNYSNE